MPSLSVGSGEGSALSEEGVEEEEWETLEQGQEEARRLSSQVP